MNRYERAATEHIELLDAERTGRNLWKFRVKGSRGIPYRITMGPLFSTCTCPDQKFRRTTCKHILFISLQVKTTSNVITDSMDAALRARFEPIRESVRYASAFVETSRVPQESIADERLTTAYLETVLVRQESVGRERDAVMPIKPAETGDDKHFRGEGCPICFEAFSAGIQVERCGTCKQSIHVHCITRWLVKKATCPLCRADWDSTGNGAVTNSLERGDSARFTHNMSTARPDSIDELIALLSRSSFE